MTIDKNTNMLLSRRQLIRTTALGIGAAALTSFFPGIASGGQFGDFSLDSQLKPLREQFDVPALSAAVMAGELIFMGAVGVRNDNVPAIKVTHDDQFHLGSCTKAMTGTLIGILVEQGAKTAAGYPLSWSTRITEIFPEFKPTMHPAYNVLTVSHLLAHRSGFSSNSMPTDPFIVNAISINFPPLSRQIYAGGVLKEAPALTPGLYNYSNRNYTVLGAIVERLTGVAWETYITTHLFGPLGMTSAGFGPMGTNLIDQPWQHLYNAASGQHQPIAPVPWSDNPEVIGPAGTVHCSTLHWMHFVQEHYHGLIGKGKLMQKSTYAQLHSPQFGGNYAGGWIVQDLSWSKAVHLHAGSNNQNYATVMLSPTKNFAVITMTNQGGPEAQKACDSTGAALVKWAQQNKILS